MEQSQPQNIQHSNKHLGRSWVLFIVIVLFTTTSLIVGFGAGYVMGQKKLTNVYLPEQIDSNPWENSKSISGTISSISGNTFSISNIVKSISTSPDQKNSDVYQIEITSNTKISKITGPIEKGKLLPTTADISAGELAVGMIVKIESAEPITSSALKALSVEVQQGALIQQTTTPPSYVPPLAPIDLPKETQSTKSGTNP